MATTGTHWETVGKPAKKGKNTSPQATQGRKKGIPDNMPRIAVASPVKESPTIYDAFIEKERRAQAKAQQQHQPQNTDYGRGDNNHSGNSTSNKKAAPAKKKAVGPSGDKKKEPPVKLEDAIVKIEVSELEAVLAKDQATFPDNPSVWLLDLASLLNLRLESVPEPDPLFEDKSPEYPMEVLPKKIRSLLINTINHCSTPTLTSFAEHCMRSMIGDMGKGIPVFGYRIFLQLLATHKPDVIMQKLPQYLEMVQSNKNRPLRCLAIMWAVGQAGVRELSRGLKVWLELMLPVLNCRALSSFGVSYLDNLLKIHSDQKTANGVIGFKNFFPIMDHIFSKQSPLPSQLQKKLIALYPRIRTISFGSHPESSLRNFFPSFLARLTPHCPPALKAEVLSSLLACLTQDPCCYGVWRQMYTKHLYHSGELLDHLVENWSTVSKTLDMKQLKETVQAFSITNEELNTQGKTGYDGYQQCAQSCKDLQLKMSCRRFPWRLLFFLIFTVCASLVAYDVYASKGFAKSRSNKFLVDSGILVFLQQVWARLRVYGGKAAVWLEVNVPYYYGRTCDIVGPYLVLFWEKLYIAGVYIVNVTEPQRRWVQRKVPEGLDWIQTQWPWLWTSIVHYATVTWEVLLHYSLLVWGYIVHYSLIAGTWLQENVFTGSLSVENLQKTAVSVLTTLQEYITAFIQWVASLIHSTMVDTSTAGDSGAKTPNIPVKGA